MRKLSKSEQDVRTKIDEYLIKNPIEVGKPGCYREVADKFDVNSEYVRERYRRLKRKDLLTEGGEGQILSGNVGDSRLKENVQTGEADYSCVTNKRIKTLEDLVAACQIDTNVWEVVSYEINKWEIGRKDKEVYLKLKKGVTSGVVNDSGVIFVEPLFQVKAKLSRRRVDKDLSKQKEAILEEIKAYRPRLDLNEVLTKYTKSNIRFANEKLDCALEINVPDLHLGKLAWGEETGDDYDIRIAVARYKSAITELIGRTNISHIDRIILVVGHDFLNVDGKNNLTTAGTPQSSDSRFYKMVQVGKKLLIETIDDLSFICKVDVIVVPGNHDTNSMLMMGDILEAWYHGSEQVTVFNSPAPRKYYQFGKVGIMYAHGHNENLNDLGMLFATENKTLWADTDFHRVHVGHFHHSKQIKFKDIEENVGCVVKIISSLSSNDAWHTEKGYLSKKSAEAFLYHREKGMVANYHYNL